LLAVTTDGANKSLCEEYDAAFSQGCAAIPSAPPSKEEIDRALAGVAFLRRLVSLQSSSLSKLGGGASSSNSNAILSSFLTSAQSRATSLIAKAASFFTKFTPFYFTRVVDNLAEGRSCQEDDTYCYFDPRGGAGGRGGGVGSGSGSSGDSSNGSPKYSEVIVFVVGGGCYSEFCNLQELVKDKAASGGALKHVIYGCTDLLSGDGFLEQLQKLGSPKLIIADIKK
jgi:hypothetical protein